MPSAFFLGANGLIGGSLIVAFHKAFPEFSFKALVRDPTSLDPYIAIGIPVIPIKGSFADLDLIAENAAEADIVVNVGDGNNVAFIGAVLRGLKKRFDSGKGVTKFIHTSGTTVFCDDATNGKADPDGKVWTDDEEDVKQIRPDKPFGAVDISVLKAQEDDYVQAYIIAPPLVYGASLGPVQRSSAAWKMRIPDAIERRRVVYVGEGTVTWGTVHIADLIDLYLIVLKKLVGEGKDNLTTNPYERYILAQSEELPYKDIVKDIARILFELGKIDSPEPVGLSYEEVGGMHAFLTSRNIKCRPKRAFELGWKPHHEGLKQAVEHDVAVCLADPGLAAYTANMKEAVKRLQ